MTTNYKPNQLGYYQGLYLTRFVECIYTERIDTRKRCVACEKRRLAGYLTTKGFLCCICLDRIKKTAKQQNCELTMVNLSLRQIETKPSDLNEDEKERRAEFQELFKTELIAYFESVEIPSIRYGNEILKRLLMKGHHPPQSFNISNALAVFRRNNICIPEQKEVVEMWRQWLRIQLRKPNPDWKLIFDNCHKHNEWTDKTICDYLRPLFEEEEKRNSLFSYLESRRIAKTQNTDQLTLPI